MASSTINVLMHKPQEEKKSPFKTQGYQNFIIPIQEPFR